MQWDKDSFFNKLCWDNWAVMSKRIKLEHFLTPYSKINSKWMKEPNVIPETTKLLEENISRTLNDINQSKILYDPPPRVMEIKTKINKWDLIKLKRFCTAKETINKVKRQPSEWEKIIANETTEKGLISKISKHLMGFPTGSVLKNLPHFGRCRRYGFNPWVGKIPCRKEWQPTPVFLPGESHGQRSLVSHSPWGHRVGHN